MSGSDRSCRPRLIKRPVGSRPMCGHRNEVGLRSEADVRETMTVAMVCDMAKLKQTFHNPGDTPVFVNLELSTSRFRLGPGEELILLYEPAERADEHGSALRIEVIQGADGPELVVWTVEQEMFFPDGTAAPRDYGRA